MARIGLLAGAGKLPGIWLNEAAARGAEVVAYQIKGMFNRGKRQVGFEESNKIESQSGPVEYNSLGRPDLRQALKVREINPGNLGRLISWLKEDKVDEVIMLGKIEKSRVFQEKNLDQEMKSLLADLPDLQDETILQALCQRLLREGFTVLPQISYLENIFLEPGWLTEPCSKADGGAQHGNLPGQLSKPFSGQIPRAFSEKYTGHCSEAEGGDGEGTEQHSRLRQEMEWGLKLARKLSDLEIGQSIMFKDGTVLAVEAVEGTDAALERAGRLVGAGGFGEPGFFMAKASRSAQDFRLDIPAVGPATIKKLNRAGGRALVVEAGGVLVLQQESFASLAREFGIAVYAGKL